MIKVTIELLPFGMEEVKRTIAEGTIYNTGEGTKEVGNYNYVLSGIKGTIEGHKRTDPVWKLLYLILRKEYGE